ncbi:MAG: hypothetical protein WCB96_09470 [Candidatus Aminicenantales bacterium]
MKERGIDKAGYLLQKNVYWVATVRKTRAWVKAKGRTPYRPFIILVMDVQADCIRQSRLFEERPAPEAVLSVLVEAMRNPAAGSGRRIRPARIDLDDAVFAQYLESSLAEIGVTCAYHPDLPLIDHALRGLEQRLGREDPRPGLLSIEGVTPLQLEELFSAASYFYQEAPWRKIDDSHLFEVRYPAEKPPTYVVIMGNAGIEYGIASYPTLEDARLQYSDLKPQEIYKKITTVSLTFGEPTSLTFDDLDAVEKYSWPVVSPTGYPLLMKVTPPRKLGVPTASEIILTAATMRSLPQFVARYLRNDRGGFQAAQANFPLPDIYKTASIGLRYPILLGEN